MFLLLLLAPGRGFLDIKGQPSLPLIGLLSLLSPRALLLHSAPLPTSLCFDPPLGLHGYCPIQFSDFWGTLPLRGPSCGWREGTALLPSLIVSLTIFYNISEFESASASVCLSDRCANRPALFTFCLVLLVSPMWFWVNKCLDYWKEKTETIPPWLLLCGRAAFFPRRMGWTI